MLHNLRVTAIVLICVLGNGGSSSSDISRAATFGSTSECSTPFISPHGTPVPFNRSRHNSAQGRLCRSRHSSGLTNATAAGGPFRAYNNMAPFSPMALNNLNNPYSPQPSTPLANADPDGLMHDSMTMHPLPQHHVLVADGTGLIGADGGPDQNRSRHSSAESEPPLRSLSLGGNTNSAFGDVAVDNNGGCSSARQRHASDGQIINDKAVSWTTLLSSEPDDDTAKKQGIADDDLDMALNALKDCDNDFSKFVQESGTH